MAKIVIIHVLGEDPILAEVEELPKPTDQFLEFTNPKRRDGKPLVYVTAGAKSFMFPWHRLSFVEVMTTEAEREETIEFFREDR
ncbi:MAG: hypothetical protein ABI670_03155 [Chloroflexota bacterium]|jgi:hypothetical protein